MDIDWDRTLWWATMVFNCCGLCWIVWMWWNHKQKEKNRNKNCWSVHEMVTGDEGFDDAVGDMWGVSYKNKYTVYDKTKLKKKHQPYVAMLDCLTDEKGEAVLEGVGFKDTLRLYGVEVVRYYIYMDYLMEKQNG